MANQVQQYSVKQLTHTDIVKSKFQDVLGKRADQFITSLVNVVNSNTSLQQADSNSVIASALVAASLNLPVDQNLGYMYIVPYGGKNSRTKIAQPQIGYKGYIQLAQRSGQYKRINNIPVYEDEYKGWNPLTEDLKYEPDFKDRNGEKPVGYYGSFELLNGFTKSVYWTKGQIEDHRKQFSKSGGHGDVPKGVWASNYNAMALKTVLRNMLTKWGPMTVEIQNANSADSGDYDHLDELRKDVTPQENQPSANDLISSAVDSQKEKKAGEISDNSSKEQEELFEHGTIKSKEADK